MTIQILRSLDFPHGTTWASYSFVSIAYCIYFMFFNVCFFFISSVKLINPGHSSHYLSSFLFNCINLYPVFNCVQIDGQLSY